MDIAREKMLKLRETVWFEDIESPTIPEYREHHESIQRILKYIDEELLKEEVKYTMTASDIAYEIKIRLEKLEEFVKEECQKGRAADRELLRTLEIRINEYSSLLFWIESYKERL